MLFTSKEEKQTINFLSNSALFGGTSYRVLKNLVKKFTQRKLLSGDYLVKEGDSCEHLFLILHGRLKICEKQADGSFTTFEIGAGEFFGDSALLTDNIIHASAFAIRDSMILALSKTDFQYFMDKHPEHMRTFVKQSIYRMRQPLSKTESLHTFCLCPAATSKNLRLFTKTFCDHLGAQSVLYLTEYNLNSLLKNSGLDPQNISDDRLSHWLNELENQYQFVIYEANHSASEWTRLCLRQADKILLIASSSESYQLNEAEQFIFKYAHASKELVVIQPQTVLLPTHTDSWLQQRYVKAIHHVVLEEPTTIARFVRYLTNQAHAVVFGGGGARGYCHIGIYKALVECQIPIDCIGGCSSGALIGALISMGLSAQEIQERIEAYVTKNKRLLSYTLPIHSFRSGKTLSKSLQQLVGTDCLSEDLWLRYFCISTSLSHLDTKMHTSGTLWKNIRASISIPGIFPPISTNDNELLIDGAVTNNLPVDLMENFSNHGKIISAKVSGVSKHNSTAIPDGWLSPWSSIRDQLKLRSLPTLPEVIMESIMLSGSRHQTEMTYRAHFHIECNAKSYNPLNFKPIRELIDLGYQTTMQAMEARDKNKTLSCAVL